MTFTREQIGTLARAASVWRHPSHEITVACGHCGWPLAVGYLDALPNGDPVIAWDNQQTVSWGSYTQDRPAVATFTCRRCARSWEANAVDQVRAGLLALGSPTLEHELHLYSPTVTLTLGVDLPCSEEDIAIFIDRLRSAESHRHLAQTAISPAGVSPVHAERDRSDAEAPVFGLSGVRFVLNLSTLVGKWWRSVRLHLDS